MPVKKLYVTYKKGHSGKSGLKRHVKKCHDGERKVRKIAESDPGAVDKNDYHTPKVRRCLFPEDINDENDKLMLSKLLEDMEKVKKCIFPEAINEEIDIWNN